MTSPVRWCWRKAIGLKSPHIHDPKTEIAPGVVRPSYALAGLVAGAIIAKPLEVRYRTIFPDDYGPSEHPSHKLLREHCKRGSPGKYGGTLLLWEDTIGGKKTKVCLYNRENSCGDTSMSYLDCDFAGKAYDDWEPSDKLLIEEAFSTARRLKLEKEREEARYAKEQRANDIIQSIFTTPEKVDEGQSTQT